jgi:hypothetical protein
LQVKNSPFIEKVTAKGYEVIYMVDPLDEYLVAQMNEYEGRGPLQLPCKPHFTYEHACVCGVYVPMCVMAL